MKKMLLIAIILAVITGVAVYSFAGYLENSSKIKYTKVVVAAVHISDRTVLTAEMLALKDIPEGADHQYSIKSIDKAVGKFTDSEIEVDEQLLSSKLHEQGEKTSGLNYLIPDGKRAFTMEVDAVTGIAGFIQQGDRVDVLCAMPLNKITSTGVDTVITSLIVSQNLEVLAVGSVITANTEEEKNATYTSVTLAVTPDEALTLNLAIASGKIRLVMRSPLNEDIVDVKPKIPELNSNVLG